MSRESDSSTKGKEPPVQRCHRNALVWPILLLLGLGMLACSLTPSPSETTVPSLSPLVSETPVALHPTSTRTATAQPSPTPIPSPSSTPTPTPTPELTITPTPTIAPTPTRLAFQGPAISYKGVRFTVAPALGNEVFAEVVPDSLSYVAFSFAPEGHCRDVGCVIVYPVKSYREDIPFGADIMDSLASAIETQSNDYFPVLMAHILLRAQTQHLRFQNGAGMRAVVMKGQDTVFANNESVIYEFHGLTDDGRYYVAATFPVDAPMLLSTCCDPTENTNKAAIPVPELPSDDAQLGAVMREYNQEAQRQLNLLNSSGFTPDLGALDALVTSLMVSPPTELPSAAEDSVGSLRIDVDYRGTWYRETFSYTRQAENIAHFVLVMPESQVERATADQVFSSIDFSKAPDALSIREGREELAWALDYVYEAHGGYFYGQFEPGTYYVAAAFVAAPISREEAGQSDDTTLYAGMTGGGASTDYQHVEIAPGENHVTLILTDRDGWACPWLYVYNGRSFDRRTEILRNVRGKRNERTEVNPIGPVEVVDGAITLRIAEEKNEITFIDEFYVTVGGIEVYAEATASVAAKIDEKDQRYLVLADGDWLELRFRLPDTLADRERVNVSVVVSGFYVPLD